MDNLTLTDQTSLRAVERTVITNEIIRHGRECEKKTRSVPATIEMKYEDGTMELRPIQIDPGQWSDPKRIEPAKSSPSTEVRLPESSVWWRDWAFRFAHRRGNG